MTYTTKNSQCIQVDRLYLIGKQQGCGGFNYVESNLQPTSRAT